MVWATEATCLCHKTLLDLENWIQDSYKAQPSPPNSLNSQGMNKCLAHSRWYRNSHAMKKGTYLRLRAGSFHRLQLVRPDLQDKYRHSIPKSSETVPQAKACMAREKIVILLSPYLSFTGIKGGPGVAAGTGTAGGNSSEVRWLLTFSWGAMAEKMPDTLKLISRGRMNRCQVQSFHQPDPRLLAFPEMTGLLLAFSLPWARQDCSHFTDEKLRPSMKKQLLLSHKEGLWGNQGLRLGWSPGTGCGGA